MCTYRVSDRMIELEQENMAFHIERLRKYVKENGKRIAAEADAKLKELKAKGVALA